MHSAETHELFSHTCARTSLRGSRCSRRRIVVDQLFDLAGGRQGGLQFVVAGYPHRDQHGHEEERHRRAEPPPPGPVRDDRKRHRQEPDELTPERRVGARHRGPRLRDQPDNRPMNTESVDAVRTIDRWVDTRW